MRHSGAGNAVPSSRVALRSRRRRSGRWRALVTRIVQPAEDLGKPFRHALGDGVGIYQAQLTADCRQHGGSQLDLGFHRRFSISSVGFAMSARAHREYEPPAFLERLAGRTQGTKTTQIRSANNQTRKLDFPVRAPPNTCASGSRKSAGRSRFRGVGERPGPRRQSARVQIYCRA